MACKGCGGSQGEQSPPVGPPPPDGPGYHPVTGDWVGIDIETGETAGWQTPAVQPDGGTPVPDR